MTRLVNYAGHLEYVYAYDDEGARAAYEKQAMREAARRDNDIAAASILGHTELGKALPVDTEIPTPTGWKLLKDLHPGDFVFAMDGSPTRIISETPITKQKVYRILFSDFTYQVASGDHQWLVSTGDRSLHTLTTVQILESGLTCRVPLCKPIAHSLKDNVRWPNLLELKRFNFYSRMFSFCSSRDTEDAAELARSQGYFVLVSGNCLEVRNDLFKTIMAIVPESHAVDMKCIGVEHETHTYIAGRSYTVTHNCVTSQTIFILRDGSLVNTIGHTPTVRMLFSHEGKTVTVTSARKRPGGDPNFKVLDDLGKVPRPFQRAAIEKVMTRSFGIVKAPLGSGKTLCAVGCMASQPVIDMDTGEEE